MKQSLSFFEYGNQRVRYEIIYVNRKTLEIAVHPDGSVLVRAPIGTSLEKIGSIVANRARWIHKQRNYFSRFEPRTPPRVYLSGETHLYLGRNYRLKVTRGKSNCVKLTRGKFHVICDDKEPLIVKSLLDEWYLARAKVIFSECLEDCLKKFKKLNIKKPKLSVRAMKRRWGSLSTSGTLNLNLSLIMAPRDCIYYVITHELCHLKHHDHSDNFYKLIDEIMPDWQHKKHKLELALI